MDVFFSELAKATEELVVAMENYVSKMPMIREKLIQTEKQSSIEDGLEYTDAEIEGIVDRQIEHHPFTNTLRDAIKPFEGVMQGD